MRFGGIIVAGTAVSLAVGGCSSVPDVTFEEGPDAAPPSRSDAAVANDAAHQGDASAVDAGGFSCPGNAPPESVGRCCGERLCLDCSLADCIRCLAAPCDEKKGLFCCGKNGNSVKCTAQGDC